MADDVGHHILCHVRLPLPLRHRTRTSQRPATLPMRLRQDLSAGFVLLYTDHDGADDGAAIWLRCGSGPPNRRPALPYPWAAGVYPADHQVCMPSVA